MSRVPGIRMPIILMLALTVPTAVVAQSPSSSAPTSTVDWPLLRGDAGRSGLGSNGPVGTPTLRWRYQAQGAANGPIVTSGDLAYTSTDDGVLHALSLADGSERWSYSPQHVPISGPAIAGGVLYAFDGLGTLLALDPTTGKEEWHSASQISGPNAPTFGDGALFVASDDDVLHALDLPGGTERWSHPVPGGQGLHNPAYADGLVYVAGDQGGYSGVDATTGMLVWHHDMGTDLTGTAVVTDGIAFVGASDDPPGHLDALDATTGELLWSDAEQVFSPGVADGIAVSPGAIGAVVAHDERSGKELWRTSIEGHTRPLAIADGVVYVAADTKHELDALDLRTGQQLWTFPVDGGIDCCAAVADGAVFVGTRQGGVYAIGGGDGTLPSGAPSALSSAPTTVNTAVPAATAPTSATSSPSTAGTPAAPSVADTLTGLWHTDTLTKAQIAAAYVAAGGTQAEGEAFFAQLGGGATDSARIGLRFDDGALTQYEQGDDRPEAVGSRPHYTVTPAGQVVITDPIDGPFTFDVAVGEDGLRLTLVEAHPETPWIATLFGSFEFRRDGAPEPSPSVTPTPPQIATQPFSGHWQTAPVTKADLEAVGVSAGFIASWTDTVMNLGLDDGSYWTGGAPTGRAMEIGDRGTYSVGPTAFVTTSSDGARTYLDWKLDGGALRFVLDEAATLAAYPSGEGDRDQIIDILRAGFNTQPYRPTDPAALPPNAASLPDGVYRTADLPTSTILATLVRSGFDPAGAASWLADNWPGATTVALQVALDSGRLTESEIVNGGPASIGWEGTEQLQDDHTLLAMASGGDDAVISYDFTLDGDSLTLKLLSDTDQDQGELMAQTAIYDTASFTRQP